MSISFTVTGAAEIASELRAAARGKPDELRAVVKKTAADIEATAKAFAPVDTGALRGSIGTTSSGNANYVETHTGPTVDYAPYVEYGTSRMAPRAFMGPAADRHLHELFAAVDQLTGDLL